MKAFVIGCLLAWMPLYSVAQVGGGFSSLYLYKGERSTTFSDVVASGDTLLAYGISYTSDSSPYTGVVLALFDTLGNTMGEYTQDPSNELMLQWYDNDLIKLSNGGYACTGILFSTQRAFLSSFNKDGGLRFSKNYGINGIFTIFPQRLLEMEDGGFLIGGFYQKLDYSSENFVKRIGPSGNQLWSRAYGEALKDDLLQSLIKIDDNTFVIGGDRHAPQGTPLASFWANNWIFAIDSFGLVKWEWFGQTNEEIGVIGLQQTTDGGWIYASYTYDVVSPDEWESKCKVVRRDSNFNLVWERILSPEGTYVNRISDLAPTPDGNWMASGTWAYRTGSGQDDIIFYNCLYKLNDQGDTLLGVRLKAPLGYEGVSSPGGFTVLPSGSVVWALRYDRYEPLPAQSFGWLIKVDNDGCVDTLCQMSGLSPELPPVETVPVHMYPNPAHNEVTFELPTIDSPALLRIFDLSGNLLWLHKFQSNTVWQAESFPSGLYFYTIGCEGQPILSGKISLLK